ncbi:unnamed protein product, partial [Hymenolepis diminuta]
LLSTKLSRFSPNYLVKSLQTPKVFSRQLCFWALQFSAISKEHSKCLLVLSGLRGLCQTDVYFQTFKMLGASDKTILEDTANECIKLNIKCGRILVSAITSIKFLVKPCTRIFPLSVKLTKC